MPVPARIIMDRLDAFRRELFAGEDYESANALEVLIEAANRAGHTRYSWEGCVDEVLRVFPSLGLEERIRKRLIELLCINSSG